jgi:DNA invertase Pin-like site-specific DNA recombinase
MSRAIGIVRVSQRSDDSGHSPEVQARAILHKAELENLSVVADDIWDENIDAAGRIRPMSGGALLADRPKLQAAVATIERGDAVAIIAERFDRLFRDFDVQREVITRVEAAGGRLVTAAGQISHATAEAELHANLNGSIAQYNKRTAMERSWAAVEIAIEEGRVPWKDTTPGYNIGPDGLLSPNERAQVVADAFRMRAGAATIAEVRGFLADHGIRRSYHGVLHLLRSRVVLGELHFGKHTPNLSAHPAIVDEGTWRRVQAVRQQRGPRQRSDRLLARLEVLRCASCGGRMVVGTQRQHGRNYPFYRCGHVREDCPRRVTISAVLVEQLVTDHIRRALEGMEGRASADRDARDADAALERAQAELDAAIRAFAALQDEPVALERLTELREVRDEAREHAGRLRGLRSALVVSASTDWELLTVAERRALIRAVVARVLVAPGRGAGRVTVELVGEEPAGG